MQTAANSAIPAYRRKPALDAGAAKGHAAGVLFVAPDGRVLMLHRSGDEKNFANHWGLPGGGVEAGETPEQGAAREVKEEVGFDADPAKFKSLDRRITPTGIAFHTFVQPVDKPFEPKLNGEHVGFTWTPLTHLPSPLHPAVADTIKNRIASGADIGADMAPEDWNALRDGFLKWTAEEEAEPEHATDSRSAIAMDRDSVREKTREGRLVVKRTHITKANVCPYRGSEIPQWRSLGLQRDKVYQMLRDPEELRKAAPTLNGVQLLIKHIPVSAEKEDSHRPMETVGSLGSDVEFDGEYLDNSLYVNAKSGIDAIESDAQKELSAGYHYKADMTPGNFRGSDYDGVMRDIVFNHVALVEDGRAGPDVVVGDSTENLYMTKPTRIAALALTMTAASIAPLLAMDSKVTVSKDAFAGLTTKNFKDGKAKLLAGVRSAVDGKLRAGIALDATMEGLAKAIDAFQDMPEEMDKPLEGESAKPLETDTAIDPIKQEAAVANTGFDAEPLKAFLAEKGMAAEDIAKVCDMMPKAAMDADETPEEKSAREKKEADDKTAKDNEMKDMVSKPAMDAALKKVATDTAAAVRATERGIRTALAEVKPWVGELSPDLALDSAEDVRRHALDMLGVPGAKTMHADALATVLSAQPKPGARPSEITRPHLAMDAAQTESFSKRFPDAGRIGAA